MHVANLDAQGLTKTFHLEHQVCLQVGHIMKFRQQARDRSRPRVGTFVDRRLLHALQHLANQRKHSGQRPDFVRVELGVLKVKLLTLHWFFPRQGDLSKPTAKVL